MEITNNSPFLSHSPMSCYLQLAHMLIASPSHPHLSSSAHQDHTTHLYLLTPEQCEGWGSPCPWAPQQLSKLVCCHPILSQSRSSLGDLHMSASYISILCSLCMPVATFKWINIIRAWSKCVNFSPFSTMYSYCYTWHLSSDISWITSLQTEPQNSLREARFWKLGLGRTNFKDWHLIKKKLIGRRLTKA